MSGILLYCTDSLFEVSDSIGTELNDNKYIVGGVGNKLLPKDKGAGLLSADENHFPQWIRLAAA